MTQVVQVPSEIHRQKEMSGIKQKLIKVLVGISDLLSRASPMILICFGGGFAGLVFYITTVLENAYKDHIYHTFHTVLNIFFGYGVVLGAVIAVCGLSGLIIREHGG